MIKACVLEEEGDFDECGGHAVRGVGYVEYFLVSDHLVEGEEDDVLPHSGVGGEADAEFADCHCYLWVC